MIRFKVIRKSVRWKRTTYHEGEFLPEDFKAADKFRNLYPSRIAEVDYEPTPAIDELKEGVNAAQKPIPLIKSTIPGKISAEIKPTGTLSVSKALSSPVKK